MKTTKQPMTLTQIGKWQIRHRLGKGGNGVVYLVTDGVNLFALKTLIRFATTIDYLRFKDEITALDKLSSIKGIMDLVEYYLPESPTFDNLPYYVMLVAESFEKHLNGETHKVLFKRYLMIVKAVSELHQLGFTHRDIKPSNILLIGDQPLLSDFGLVSFPKKSSLSGRNENIGAKWTIAPEMKRTSTTADFKKADVYSLAKTLWILITGNQKGFEGQYIPKSSISVDRYVDVKINAMTNADTWHYFSIVLLERLLVQATSNDPKIRPTAEEFYDMLALWLKLNTDFFARNAHDWKEALDVLFPYGIPHQCEWDTLPEIIKVLKVQTEFDNLNYCFLPGRGGND